MSVLVDRIGRKKYRLLFTGLFAAIAAAIVLANRILRMSQAQGMRYTMGFGMEDCLRLVDFRTGMLLILTALCVFALYRLLFSAFRPERFFTLTAFGFGLLYLVGLTPLAIPDEVTHFQAIYDLACRLPLCNGIEAAGDFSGFGNHDSVCTGYLRILRDFGRAAAPVDAAVAGGSALSQMWTLVYVAEYIPQIVGVALAMLLGRNMVTAFLLGRLCNLIFYCACLYLAIKRTPRFRLMFGFAGLMPMAIQQAASLSYDSFVNALGLLLMASMLKAIYGEGPLPLGEYLFILVTAVILTPAKGIYVVFVLFFFLIPRERFPMKGRSRGFWAAVLLLCCLGFFALISLPQMLRILGQTRPGFEVTGESQNTLARVLENPMLTVRIFAATFNVYILDWLGSAIGTQLGTYAIELPVWIIPAFAGCMLLAAQSEGHRAPELPRGFRVCCLVCSALVIFAFMVTMYFAWISVDDYIIYGVQGRYFTCIIPLLMMAATGKSLRFELKNEGRGLSVLVILLSARTFLEILSYSMSHTL